MSFDVNKVDANKNAERFTGFANVYDDARPKMPDYVTEVMFTVT